MGHPVDLHQNERTYYPLNLSEYEVVTYLLKYRSKVDVLSMVSTNTPLLEASDLVSFNQELICLYASLDNVLDKLQLEERETTVLRYLKEGHSLRDITNLDIGYDGNIYRIVERIAKKVVNQNNQDWSRSVAITLPPS